MPQPSFKPASPDEFRQAIQSATHHHFESAHGDVAALHARIEQSFRDYSIGDSPFSDARSRIDSTVDFVSRSAGIVGLVAALGGIAYCLS